MSYDGNVRDADDVAPGFLDNPSRSIRRGIRSYFIGLMLSVLLTVLSFYTAGTRWIWEPALPAALTALAIAQIGVHLVFFLHITTAPDNINTVLALGFAVLIVALIIGGSLWIMYHLNQNMLPMHQITGIQR